MAIAFAERLGVEAEFIAIDSRDTYAEKVGFVDGCCDLDDAIFEELFDYLYRETDPNHLHAYFPGLHTRFGDNQARGPVRLGVDGNNLVRAIQQRLQ